MSDDGKNKIDAVVDEVIESKRLRQGASGLSKLCVFLANIGMIITPIFVIILMQEYYERSYQNPADPYWYTIGGAIIFLIILFLRALFKKGVKK